MHAWLPSLQSINMKRKNSKKKSNFVFMKWNSNFIHKIFSKLLLFPSQTKIDLTGKLIWKNFGIEFSILPSFYIGPCNQTCTKIEKEEKQLNYNDKYIKNKNSNNY